MVAALVCQRHLNRLEVEKADEIVVASRYQEKDFFVNGALPVSILNARGFLRGHRFERVTGR